MVFRSRAPKAPLDELIQTFWHYEGYSSPHLLERILPTGTFELVFNLRDDELRIHDADPVSCSRFSGALVAGPHGSYFTTDAAEETFVMGAHFRPGGAFPFLSSPAGHLADRHVDLRDVWGSAAGELHERLVEAASADERFSILENALLVRLSNAREGHWAVPAALSALGRHVRVREVVREIDLSERRFVDVFTSEVGLAPKRYSRIRRFQRILEQLPSGRAPDWALLALHGGYSDQAHLIHDFQEFCGLSPKDYTDRMQQLHRRGQRGKWNHVPVGTEASLFYNTPRTTPDDPPSRRHHEQETSAFRGLDTTRVDRSPSGRRSPC